MRPDAALFAPRNGALESFDASTALVTREQDATMRTTMTDMSDRASYKSSNEAPRDLTVHESIKNLLTRVDALQTRCSALETANEELKSEMEHLKANHAMNEPRQSTNGNLTGYASSNSSSEKGLPTYSEAGPNSFIATEELNRKIDMISEILRGHHERIATQAAQQEDLVKRFDSKDKEFTWLKGLYGKLKKDLQSLEEAFDEADIDNNRGRSLSKAGGSAAEVGSYFMDEVQQVQKSLTELTLKCEKGYAEFDGRCAALAAVVEGGEIEPARRGQQWPAGDSNEDSYASHKGRSASKKDVVDLKDWQYQVQRLARNKQVIDEASTRDALDAMFFQLSDIMSNSSGDFVLSEGSFSTTSDEAFGLRDRVLRRLALFDQYATALQEVQAKKGKVDW